MIIIIIIMIGAPQGAPARHLRPGLQGVGGPKSYNAECPAKYMHTICSSKCLSAAIRN